MSRRLFLLFALVSMVVCTSAPSLLARDRIWSGLVYASNTPEPKAPPRELARYAPQLSKVFGYNQFELLNQQERRIDGETERWLVPGKEFSLRVAGTRESAQKYLLRLELYREDKMLVRTKAQLGPHSPIAFRGPLYGKGQLIIVLLVKP